MLRIEILEMVKNLTKDFGVISEKDSTYTYFFSLEHQNYFFFKEKYVWPCHAGPKKAIARGKTNDPYPFGAAYQNIILYTITQQQIQLNKSKRAQSFIINGQKMERVKNLMAQRFPLS